MPDIRNMIQRGKTFGGRTLQRALLYAGRTPLGGAGVVVESRGAEAVIRTETGAPLSKPPRLIDAILGTSYLIGANKWMYEWLEAIESFGTWVPKPNGKSHNDASREFARNYAEIKNTGFFGLYGIELFQVLIEINVQPIPGGQPVLLRETAREDGQFGYWFEALNPITVECIEAPAARGLAALDRLEPGLAPTSPGRAQGGPEPVDRRPGAG
jgi:hypothetical protein